MNDMFDSYSKFSINTSKIFPHPIQCFFYSNNLPKTIEYMVQFVIVGSLIVIYSRFKIEYIIIAVNYIMNLGKQ